MPIICFGVSVNGTLLLRKEFQPSVDNFCIRGDLKEDSFHNGMANLEAVDTGGNLPCLQMWYVYKIELTWHWNKSFAHVILIHRETGFRIIVSDVCWFGSDAGNVHSNEVVYGILAQLLQKIQFTVSTCPTPKAYYKYMYDMYENM